MNQVTTLLKVGSTDLVLRMIEVGMPIRDLALENPIRAIREISHDITGRRAVRLANGREASALEIQQEYQQRASELVDRYGGSATDRRIVELWGRVLKAVDNDDLSTVEREIDWVAKLRLIKRFCQRHEVAMADPKVAQIDLAYHDVRRNRGIFSVLEKRDAVDRVVGDLRVFEAKSVPPQTTRARLRGEFIRRAQERRRDFTVDWVHLKLNDQAQRTVLCKDPFRSVDERVDRLIASM